jgi:hypothetical protein
MKIAFVGDVHVGNHARMGGPVEAGLNLRCRQIISVFATAVAHAAEANAPLVVLGDLFDTHRPLPQMLTAVQDAIKAGARPGAPQPIILVGNHDQASVAAGDHALGPLRAYAKIIEVPTIVPVGDGMTLVCVPFRPGVATEWLPGVVGSLMDSHGAAMRRPVLCVHLGISDKDTAPFLVGAPDSVPVDLLLELARRHGFSNVLAGNWHSRKVWGRTVMQVGALVPTGWDNPGATGYGTLAMCDGGVLSYAELPGPRFMTVHDEDDMTAAVAAGARNQVYAVARAQSGELRAWTDRMEAAVRTAAICAAVVEPDKGESEAAVRTAAYSARSALSVSAALEAYVAQMPVEDGVSRPHVLHRVRRLLGLSDGIADGAAPKDGV